MTLRSAIFFSVLALILVSLFGSTLRAGTISGRISLIDSNGSGNRKDFSDAVVWLVPVGDSDVRLPHRRVEMLQKDKRFSPHVLVITTGTTVDFPNLDPIFHNAFSNYDGQVFDVALYPPGSSRAVRFDRPGIVRVFCNIHPSMSAIIVVLDSSYFGVTTRDGQFSIPNVPSGTYEIHFFHERATQQVLDRLTHKMFVSNDDQVLPDVTISEAGYLPVAHKNKYGRDYPPTSEDSPKYRWPF
jgi:plastocyanin